MSIRDDVLEADLINDEGLRLKRYIDTVGKNTIGVGRNIDDVGISREEALYLLRNDIRRVRDELWKGFPWIESRPDDVQRGLVSMDFNMGFHGLSEFKLMLAAIHAGDYETAATEAENSKWATQVGSRAHRIASLFRGAR